MEIGKGYIKIKDYNHHLMFEREYLNGQKNGKGKNIIMIMVIYYLKVII